MEIPKDASKIKVLVIGDVMLDRYWWGNVSRISPEAPVPVVNLESVSATLGGAANVAANIVGLGAEPFLVGVIGEDEAAAAILGIAKSKNISADFLWKSSERRTTVKTRIIAHNQQIVRVDQETKTNLSEFEEESVWKIAEILIGQVEIVVISDYGKGLLTEKLLSSLITKSNDAGKLVLVDPKGKSFTKYKGATMLTPNRFELTEVSNGEQYSQISVEENGGKLLSELSLTYLLVTQGEDGMTLFEKDKALNHLSVEPRNVYDVTGAGDTVIACLAVAMAAGVSFLEAAKTANIAAGLVIEKIGTTAITSEMLDRL